MTTETPDIFISHNSRDKQLIEPIVERLEADYQIRSWLDTWDLHPAEDWEPEIQRALKECTSSAIVLGANGWGNYHFKEARLALERRKRNPGFKVIPVLLPGANQEEMAKLDDFFQRTHRVDFSNGIDDEEAFRRLLAAIRGEAPGPPAMTVYSINRDARVWQNAAIAEKESLLYRGSELRAAQKLTQAHAEELSPAAVSFLSASAATEQRNIQMGRRRQQKIIAGLVVGLILIAVAAVYAFKKRTEAIQQRDTALSNLATIYYNQAQVAAQSKNLVSALDLTKRAIETTPPSDARLDIYKLRAFQLERLLPPKMVSHAMEFSPNLDRVVAGDPSIDFGVWKVKTGELIRVLPGCAKLNCYGPIFSPDGRLVAAGHVADPLGSSERGLNGNKLLVWDAATGELKREIYEAELNNTDRWIWFRFTPDSKGIVTPSGTGFYVWDIASDKQLPPIHTEGRVRTLAGRRQPVAFSRNPSRNLAITITAGAGGQVASVWNITEGRVELKLPVANDIAFIDFTDDASQIVALTRTRNERQWTLRVWDVQSGRSTTAFTDNFERNIVGMSPDGQVLITCPGDYSTIIPIDLKGQPLWQPQNQPDLVDDGDVHRSWSSLDAFLSADGKYIVTSTRFWGNSQELRFFHARTGVPAFAPIALQGVGTAVFSPSELELGLVVDLSAQLRKLVPTGEQNALPAETPLLKPEEKFDAAYPVADGKTVLTMERVKRKREYGTTRSQLWDIASARPLWGEGVFTNQVSFVDVSPDGRRFAMLSRVNEDPYGLSGGFNLDVREVDSGEPVKGFTERTGAFETAVFSRDGKRIVTLENEPQRIRIWDALTGEEVAGSVGELAGAGPATLTRYGEFALTWKGADYVSGELDLWATGVNGGTPGRIAHLNAGLLAFGVLRQSRRLNLLPGGIISADWGRENKVVIRTKSGEGEVLMNGSGGALRLPSFAESEGRPGWLSPDGRVILTLDNHQQLRLWEATTGEPVSENIWSDGAVVSAEFSPGGELVTWVTENGSVRSFLVAPPKKD